MKVALVYDRVNKWGGAERVLLALHKLFPDAPLYTSVYDKKSAPWADVFSVETSFLQKLPFASRKHEILAPLMPLAFESFDFSDFDLVISVTSEAAKGIITKPQTRHICYCLTPTRYLWSGYDEYFKNDKLKFLSKPVIARLRKWDLTAAGRPDAFVAISKEVQKRIREYYGRESELVYPPVDLGESVKGKALRGKNRTLPFTLNAKPYFLVVSRLSKFTKYKRVDLAIEACNELGLPLMIVGEGSWKEELERISGPTIKFIGNVDDKELIEIYKNCRALIFPGFEDLGLTMIEAQGMGKPIVAYGRGGAKEIVIDGKTGLLFGEQTVESLVKEVSKLEMMTFDPKACVANAQRFSQEKFKKEFLSVVNRLI